MEDMNINSVKAKVLTAALPYIQKYNGKTVVVKYNNCFSVVFLDIRQGGC